MIQELTFFKKLFHFIPPTLTLTVLCIRPDDTTTPWSSLNDLNTFGAPPTNFVTVVMAPSRIACPPLWN